LIAQEISLTDSMQIAVRAIAANAKNERRSGAQESWRLIAWLKSY
jgi:hypothetical protein